MGRCASAVPKPGELESDTVFIRVNRYMWIHSITSSVLEPYLDLYLLKLYTVICKHLKFKSIWNLELIRQLVEKIFILYNMKSIRGHSHRTQDLE